jgi:hypothetical protein
MAVLLRHTLEKAVSSKRFASTGHTTLAFGFTAFESFHASSNEGVNVE